MFDICLKIHNKYTKVVKVWKKKLKNLTTTLPREPVLPESQAKTSKAVNKKSIFKNGCKSGKK